MRNHNKLTLIVFKDENIGETGLGIKGMVRDETTNAATSGVLMAHDIIEHMNGPKEIGTIADEMEALGAIWYVRGQWGDLSRDGIGSAYSVEENIASDFTRMFRDFFYGAYLPLNVSRNMPCDADDAFDDILEYVKRDALKELDDSELEAGSDAHNALQDYLKVCKPYMRIGYRKAVAKYEKHGRHFANDLFWTISAAVDKVTKRGMDFEGQEYRLSFGTDNNGNVYAHMEEDYGEEY